MATPDEATDNSLAARTAAFGVHLLTASGAALGLLALMAAVERRWALMFLWLGIALFVDASTARSRGGSRSRGSCRAGPVTCSTLWSIS